MKTKILISDTDRQKTFRQVCIDNRIDILNEAPFDDGICPAIEFNVSFRHPQDLFRLGSDFATVRMVEFRESI